MATQFTKATLAGCWAHARRKFIEAEKGMPKGKSGKATVAISYLHDALSKLVEISMINCPLFI